MFDIAVFQERINAPGFSLLEALPGNLQHSLAKPSSEKVLRLLNACLPYLTGDIAKDFIVNALVETGYSVSSVRGNYLAYLQKVGMFQKVNRLNWRLTPEFVKNVMDGGGGGAGSAPEKPAADPSELDQTETILDSLDEKSLSVWEYLLAKSSPNGGADDERELKNLNYGTYGCEKAFVELKDKGVKDSIEFRGAICSLESKGVILTKVSGDHGALLITLYPTKMRQLVAKVDNRQGIKARATASAGAMADLATRFRDRINARDFTRVKMAGFTPISPSLVKLFSAISMLPSFPTFTHAFFEKKFMALGLHSSCLGYLSNFFIEKIDDSEWKITDVYINAVLEDPAKRMGGEAEVPVQATEEEGELETIVDEIADSSETVGLETAEPPEPPFKVIDVTNVLATIELLEEKSRRYGRIIEPMTQKKAQVDFLIDRLKDEFSIPDC